MRRIALIVLAACGHPSSAHLAPDADVDAAVDAPPDAPPPPLHFDTTAVDMGVVGARGVGVRVGNTGLAIFNDSTTPLTVTLDVTPPFVADGCWVPVDVGGVCGVTVSVAPTALGPLAGTFTANGISIPVTATVEGAVNAWVQPYDPGTVTTDPPCDPCHNGGCCYPDHTVVTATATPAVGASIAGWNDPSCGTSTTCTATAGIVAQELRPAMALDLVPFTVNFTGDGIGEVLVSDFVGHQELCTSSCAVNVVPDHEIGVEFSTPDDFGGFDGDPPDQYGSKGYPAGTTQATVSFLRRPGEVDFVGATDADFGPSNDVAVAQNGMVRIFDGNLVERWSVPGMQARYTLAGNVFVSDGTLHKFDAGGLALPTVAATGVPVTTTPADGAIVLDGGTYRVVDATAATLGTLAFTSTFRGCIVATGDGHIHAGVDDPTTSDHDMDFDNYTADGTLIDVTPASYGEDCTTHQDWRGDYVLTNSAFSEVKCQYRGHTVDVNYDVSESPHTAGAADAAGTVTWFYAHEGWEVSEPTAVGLDLYRPGVGKLLSRPAYFRIGDFNKGLHPLDIVVSPDGHIAITAIWKRFNGVTPIVLVFPPF